MFETFPRNIYMYIYVYISPTLAASSSTGRGATTVMATQLAEWTNGEGALVKVPPNAKAALEAKYRGQKNLGEKAPRRPPSPTMARCTA